MDTNSQYFPTLFEIKYNIYKSLSIQTFYPHDNITTRFSHNFVQLWEIKKG